MKIVRMLFYFFFLSSSNRLERSSKSISSLSFLSCGEVLEPPLVGTSGKSDGTLGRFGKSSFEFDGGIFDRGCGFGVFKF